METNKFEKHDKVDSKLHVDSENEDKVKLLVYLRVARDQENEFDWKFTNVEINKDKIKEINGLVNHGEEEEIK